jgi:hypothetical protein
LKFVRLSHGPKFIPFCYEFLISELKAFDHS